MTTSCQRHLLLSQQLHILLVHARVQCNEKNFVKFHLPKMTSDDRGETECFRSAEAMEHTPLRPQNCLNVVGMTGDVNLELAALSQYVLVVVCLLTVGSHVGKHFISSLGPSVMQRLEISRAEYGLVFSLQGIPGAILPMLGGIAISALRLRYGLVAVVLAATTLAGQALTCVAVQGRSYWALLIGYVYHSSVWVIPYISGSFHSGDGKS